MRVLLDTCVVLDYLENREPFFDDALDLMISAANRDIDGCITANTTTDLFYIIHQKLHDPKKTKKVLSKLLGLLSVIDTTEEDCRNAVAADTSDYEDAVQMETAARAGLDCIVTRNEKDYRRSGTPVLTPGEFLKTLETN